MVAPIVRSLLTREPVGEGIDEVELQPVHPVPADERLERRGQVVAGLGVARIEAGVIGALLRREEHLPEPPERLRLNADERHREPDQVLKPHRLDAPDVPGEVGQLDLAHLPVAAILVAGGPLIGMPAVVQDGRPEPHLPGERALPLEVVRVDVDGVDVPGREERQSRRFRDRSRRTPREARPVLRNTSQDLVVWQPPEVEPDREFVPVGDADRPLGDDDLAVVDLAVPVGPSDPGVVDDVGERPRARVDAVEVVEAVHRCARVRRAVHEVVAPRGDVERTVLHAARVPLVVKAHRGEVP